MDTKLTLSLFTLFTICMLTACQQPVTSSQTIELANPAAQYCIDSGGTLEIVKKDDGETGVCTLADGEKIDSWALFHRDHQ